MKSIQSLLKDVAFEMFRIADTETRIYQPIVVSDI